MTIDEATHEDVVVPAPGVRERTGPPTRDWRRPAAFVLTVLVALGVVGYLVVQLRDAHRDLDRYAAAQVTDAEVLQRARDLAVTLTTYDYRDLQAQQRQLAQGSTDAFQKKFAQTNKTLGPMFVQLHASAKGSVVDAAVQDVQGDLATVLLFVDQQARSKQSAKPTSQASRLRLHLVRQGGLWLLDSVDLL